MSRVGVPIAAALLAIACLVFGGPAYTRFVAGATAVLRDANPPRSLPVAVVPRDSTLVVHTRSGVLRVDVGAIAWNLPVLLCLWACVVRRRWGAFAAVAALLVVVHALVADVEVRKALGDVSGWRYALTRAWFVFAAPAFPVLAVAIAWAAFARGGASRPATRSA